MWELSLVQDVAIILDTYTLLLRLGLRVKRGFPLMKPIIGLGSLRLGFISKTFDFLKILIMKIFKYVLKVFLNFSGDGKISVELT